MRLHSLLYIPLLRLCALFTTLQGFWWFGLSFSCYSSGQSFLFSVRGVPRICQREGKQLNISNVECCRTDFCNMDLKPTLSTFYVSGMDLLIGKKNTKLAFLIALPQPTQKSSLAPIDTLFPLGGPLCLGSYHPPPQNLSKVYTL